MAKKNKDHFYYHFLPKTSLIRLEVACRQGQLAKVVALLAHRAKVNPFKQSRELLNSLHVAAKNAHSKVAVYLAAKAVVRRADLINLADAIGFTALIYSAVNKRDPVVVARTLLKLGAQVNHKDALYGNTALHWAIKNQNWKIARILVEEPNVDFLSVNLFGQTALDMLNLISITTPPKPGGNVADLQDDEKEKNIHVPILRQIIMQKAKVSNVAGDEAKNAVDERGKVEINQIPSEWLALFTPPIYLGWTGQTLNASLGPLVKILSLFLCLIFAGLTLKNVSSSRRQLVQLLPPSILFTLKVLMYWSWSAWVMPLVNSSPLTPILFYISTATTWLGLIGTKLSDPGYCKSLPTTEERAQEIVDLGECNQLTYDNWCGTCVLKKPKNSKHCVVCDKCVDKFDHHCYFLNKCVGSKNRHFFLLLLCADFLCGIVFLSSCLHYYFTSKTSNSNGMGITELLVDANWWSAIGKNTWLNIAVSATLAQSMCVGAMLIFKLYKVISNNYFRHEH